jgi:cbb3-type cytochrome oxidase subunit 3
MATQNRIRRILAGLAFTLGLQVIVSLVYTGLAFSAASSRTALPEGTVSIIALGVTLGAFLIGGFVVGWREGKFPLVDALVVALLTLILTAVVYVALPSGNKAQFVGGAWLTDHAGHIAIAAPTLLFVALTVIAALIGAYWGWRTALRSEGQLASIAVLAGLMAIIFGPCILLAIGRDPTNTSNPGLPLLFLGIVFALLLAIVGIGFWLFSREARRESTYEANTSISPEHHKKIA